MAETKFEFDQINKLAEVIETNISKLGIAQLLMCSDESTLTLLNTLIGNFAYDVSFVNDNFYRLYK